MFLDAAAEEPPAEPTATNTALTLVLAHAIQRSIDSGASKDQAELARKLGMTRARVTQLLDLTLLDPAIQERVLAAESINSTSFTERGLRRACSNESWQVQAEALIGRRSGS